MEKNLTSGSVLKNIVYFSLPYLLSYFLQTLYGMADLFIIGQFEGVAGTTAVSIGSQVMHMLTVMIVGLAMGTTVSIGQAIGANDKRRAANAIGNTVTLFAMVAAGMLAILLLLVNPILQVMSTPQEAVAGTRIYLTICFVGIPFIIAYNVISSIFRGLGDSKSPMYFIAIACVINIVLDYLFMGAFHMGSAGAALGNNTFPGGKCCDLALYDSQTENGDCSEKAGFSTEKASYGTDFAHRRAGGISGWVYPGRISCYYDHRQPSRIKPGGSRRYCGKDHQFSVSCAILDAFFRVSTGGTEYRCRKARPCQRDASLRSADRRRIRHFYRNPDPVYRITGRWSVYIRSDCDRIWKPVHMRLYF